MNLLLMTLSSGIAQIRTIIVRYRAAPSQVHKRGDQARAAPVLFHKARPDSWISGMYPCRKHPTMDSGVSTVTIESFGLSSRLA